MKKEHLSNTHCHSSQESPLLQGILQKDQDPDYRTAGAGAETSPWCMSTLPVMPLTATPWRTA